MILKILKTLIYKRPIANTNNEIKAGYTKLFLKSVIRKCDLHISQNPTFQTRTY